MNDKDVITRANRLGVKQLDLANALGLSPDKISKVFRGERGWRGSELVRAIEFLDAIEDRSGIHNLPDLPSYDGVRDYLAIPILPTFAGMGGGGTGDGDHDYGLVPRRLIEDELHARPIDFILIEARGDSMMPDFRHGDQILIDKRDTNPAQPGSFALWDGDAYVIKLVERVAGNKNRLRVSSANARYSACELSIDDIQIMGRPVWFARRL